MVNTSSCGFEPKLCDIIDCCTVTVEALNPKENLVVETSTLLELSMQCLGTAVEL